VVIWVWDPKKNAANERNHGFDFELASRVFDDPLARTRPDPKLTVFVVHTLPEFDPDEGDEIGRIISARKATPRERRAYEEDSE
jgi:uncharacterized protein